MKNIDFKKLSVLIFIIVIISIIILFFVNYNNPSKKEKELAENLSTKYYINLTSGFATSYGGLDLLFQQDKVTYSDLNTASILNIAIKYAEDKSINISETEDTINALSKEYENINEYAVYNGKGIRTSIKELFGITFNNSSSTKNISYIYDFYYNKTFDVYLMKRNNVNFNKINEQGIDYHIIKTIKKNKKLITTIAIAYTYDNGSTYIYAQDKLGEKIISEDTTSFPVDKVDEFDHFNITLKQTKDKNYVLESIEKVK